MGIREWTIVVGVVVGVAILLWLAARWRRRRYDDIYGYDSGDRDYDDEYSSELPSGGARTVGYRDSSDIERTNVEIKERAKSLKPRLASFENSLRQEEQLDDESSQEVPEAASLEREGSMREMFKKEAPEYTKPSVEPSAKPAAKTAVKPEPDQSMELFGHQVPLLLDPAEEHSEIDENLDELAEKHVGDSENAVGDPPLTKSLAAEVEETDRASISDWETNQITNPTRETKLAEREREAQGSKSRSSSNTKKPQKKTAALDSEKGKSSAQPSNDPPEVIVINLMKSPDSPFEGALLLRALTELGMRFGEMEIFHYCGKRGNERPQFGMANLLSPGTFDIENMAALRTHALCFFLELEEGADNMQLYDTMLSVINKLREEVGGEIRDDNRSVFTIQTREHCRNQIRDFQRRYLIRKQ